MMPKTSDFDYDLPGKLIAQKPVEPRDKSRLMVLDRRAGELRHHHFGELPTLLREGDLLVLNDTRVIPAKFFCRRRTGGQIEGLFLRELSTGRWEVMLKGAGRCKVAEELTFIEEPSAIVKLEKRLGDGLWRVAVSPPCDAVELLERIGTTPLPPYIHREAYHGRPGHDSFSSRARRPCYIPRTKRPQGAGHPCHGDIDRLTYQTVYAARPGAVAAPTAGLHFTENILADLKDRRIESVNVTLHVGLGTFAPVKAEQLDRHEMHSEWYELSAETAEAVVAAKNQGRRIVAVGTTSVRVLETAAAEGPMDFGELSRASARTGWTDLFIYPPGEFRVVDVLLTNFHLPRSTLLMLIAAFCSPGSTDGIQIIKDAYAEAIRQKYRFYSYGDAMLIL